MPQSLFTLRVTLDDATTHDFPQKHTFEEAKGAIQEMMQEGVFTLPTLSPVTFVPFPRVVKIELIAVV